MNATVRTSLEHCLTAVTAALAEPAPVAELAGGPPWIELGPMGRRPRWNPPSLAGGAAGLALLFAELAHHDPAYRRVAHDHLTTAVAHARQAPVGGLHTGLAGIALAARAAARSPRDYATLLDGLDGQVTAWAHGTATVEGERRAHRGGTTFVAYDVISGLTGVGRYLLQRADRAAPADPALHAVLGFLVGLTRPCPGVPGRPGWWVAHSPTPVASDAEDGHLNLGVAHGVAGPLALLALAWTAGHRVPGQEEAIGRIVDWYLENRGPDQQNAGWPATIPVVEAPRRAGVRRSAPSWCYGDPGIARALQLAGAALGEPSWTKAARLAICDVAIEWTRSGPGLAETMLCHGGAGLLQVLWRMNSEFDDQDLARAIDDVAAFVLAGFTPEAPFGFRARHMGESTELDIPGFLEGAAGTALAISTYVTGRDPRTGWDAALLIS